MKKYRLQSAKKKLLLWLLLCFLALYLPTSVYGHAELMQSTPENGAQLVESPAEIVLYFSEGVQTGEIALLDNQGQAREVGALDFTGADRRTVEVALPPLDEGIYTVRWQMLAQDGHITSSSFFFVIGAEMPTREEFLHFLDVQSGPSQVATQPMEPPARGLLFLAVAGLLGIPLAWLLVLQPAQSRTGIQIGAPGNRLLKRLLQAGGIAVLLGSTLLVAGQYTALHSRWEIAALGAFLYTTPGGQIALARVVLGSGLIIAGFRFRRPRTLLSISAASGLLLALSINRSSHAASLLPDPAVWIDLVHLLAAGFWAGGVALLGWLLVPRVANAIAPTTETRDAAPHLQSTAPDISRLDAPGPRSILPLISAATARFSILALAAVTIAVATGLLLAAWLLPTPQALWQTLYGTALGTKLGFLVIAVGLGATHRYLTLPRLTVKGIAGTETGDGQQQDHLRGFRRSIGAEVVAIMGIMLLSGLLTSAPPATITAQAGSEQAILDTDAMEHSMQGRLGNAPMQVQVTPFQTGLNVFDVTFDETEPELENFTLLLRLPEQQIELPAFELAEIEPGLWSTVGALPVAGIWQARAAAFINGSFQAERFEIALHAHDEHAPDEHAHHEHAEDAHASEESDVAPPTQAEPPTRPETTGEFPRLLRLAAALVAILGTLVVIYDIRRFRHTRLQAHAAPDKPRQD